MRIEVIHKLGGRNGYKGAGKHTSQSVPALLTILRRLAEDAAELVNRMLFHFSQQSDVTPSHISAYELLMEICRHSRDFPTALTISSLLIHNGPIAAAGADEKMHRALQRLSGAGVIEHNPQTGIYVVTAARRHALQMLRQHCNFSLLLRAPEGGEIPYRKKGMKIDPGKFPTHPLPLAK